MAEAKCLVQVGPRPPLLRWVLGIGRCCGFRCPGRLLRVDACVGFGAR